MAVPKSPPRIIVIHHDGLDIFILRISICGYCGPFLEEFGVSRLGGQ